MLTRPDSNPLELTRGGHGEVGYRVIPELRGRGVATRAVKLPRDWAAESLRPRTIEILAREDDAPSRAVARASGYGTRRSCGACRAARSLDRPS